jgi:hypothetical protein
MALSADPGDAAAATADEVIDLGDMASCVRREIQKRLAVYPKLVAAGKLSQAKANLEIATMRRVLALVMWHRDRDGMVEWFGEKPEEEP